MIDGCKPFNFSSEKMGETLKRWMKVYFCTLMVSSFVYLSYSATRRWGYPLASTSVSPSSAAGYAATNISHVVFGIGGSARTWPRRRGYSELWWRPGETRGHVWLDEEPRRGTWPDTCPPYRVSAADTSRFGARAAASRIAAIVAEAYAVGPEGTRWFVMGDDDTVFFVENLVAVLGRYDHREMYYIGAPSESVEQDVMHSYGMAFGGGGFAVSYPAAAELARVIKGCLERYASFYGSDQRIQACLSELGVPLTREPGFHQVDLKGDVYGMLAAHPITPLVSLHHLDYVKPISPTGSNQVDSVRSLVDASRFDPARVLQQSFCYLREPGLNWSVSVSWGYTAQLYPWVLPPRTLEVPLQTFQTWRSVSDGPFTFNSRPLAGPDRPCDRPIFFFLDRIHEGTDAGATVTEYSRHEVEKEKACERLGYSAAASVERVRVSAPRMDPTVWKRAPRRQCCEAHRDGLMSIEINVRDCYVGEITSPP